MDQNLRGMQKRIEAVNYLRKCLKCLYAQTGLSLSLSRSIIYIKFLSNFDKDTIVIAIYWLRAFTKQQILWCVPAVLFIYQEWSKQGQLVNSDRIMGIHKGSEG